MVAAARASINVQISEFKRFVFLRNKLICCVWVIRYVIDRKAKRFLLTSKDNLYSHDLFFDFRSFRATGLYEYANSRLYKIGVDLHGDAHWAPASSTTGQPRVVWIPQATRAQPRVASTGVSRFSAQCSQLFVRSRAVT